METGEMYPDNATMTGRQSANAAIGIARTTAIFSGSQRCKYAVIRGARTKSPAVARTESAKPGSRDCHGSIVTTAAIAKPSAGSESPRCRVDIAINITAAMAAALNTDGVGRTSAIKQASAIAVANKRAGTLRKINCMHHKTNAETIAKLAPLTATK